MLSHPLLGPKITKVEQHSEYEDFVSQNVDDPTHRNIDIAEIIFKNTEICLATLYIPIKYDFTNTSLSSNWPVNNLILLLMMTGTPW